MMYRATKTFSGAIKIRKGEVRELDKDTAAGLLRAGYIEAVKGAEKNERAPKGKRNHDE
jgi:hypothetical protein